MSGIMELITNNLVQILTTIITGLVGYIGFKIKNSIAELVEDKEKKEIIDKTVKYIEQTKKGLSCKEKKEEALRMSLEWMNQKKLTISDTELEILIESSVNCL